MNIVIYQCQNNIKLRIIDYIYLNDDVLNLIMLYSPISIIRKYIQTSKQARKLLLNHDFWIKKFNYDQLMIYKYMYYNTYPKNLYWIKEYTKCHYVKSCLSKILPKYHSHHYNNYPLCIEYKIPIDTDLSWISFNFNHRIQHTITTYHHLLRTKNLYLCIQKSGIQTYIYCIIDLDDDFNITKSIKPDKFDYYMQKMIYFLYPHSYKLL